MPILTLTVLTNPIAKQANIWREARNINAINIVNIPFPLVDSKLLSMPLLLRLLGTGTYYAQQDEIWMLSRVGITRNDVLWDGCHRDVAKSSISMSITISLNYFKQEIQGSSVNVYNRKAKMQRHRQSAWLLPFFCISATRLSVTDSTEKTTTSQWLE